MQQREALTSFYQSTCLCLSPLISNNFHTIAEAPKNPPGAPGGPPKEDYVPNFLARYILSRDIPVPRWQPSLNADHDWTVPAEVVLNAAAVNFESLEPDVFDDFW